MALALFVPLSSLSLYRPATRTPETSGCTLFYGK